MEKTPWSAPVAVYDIPEAGLHIEIEAPPAVREAVATLASVRELPRLSAIFDVTRRGAGAHVTGQVEALVGQTCVVSLEPIESKLDERIDVTFTPSTDAATSDDNDPPEPLVGGTVDLGAIATEFLLLAIDPYPRKEGVQFAAPKAEEGGERPFAALETLKKRLGGGKP
jgi:uncharacterized metal-binding protein YceD (DUF177 family)